MFLPPTGLLIAAVITFLFKKEIFLVISEIGVQFGGLVTFIASYGLLALAVTAGVLGAIGLVGDRAMLRRLVFGGAGVITAYLSSEIIKLLVREERPCRMIDTTTAMICPNTGDWSWPSNHSVIAAAFATAIALAFPQLARFVYPVAAVIALSRVLAGVHYLHDVLSGLALGVIVVLVVIHLLRRFPGGSDSTRLRKPESDPHHPAGEAGKDSSTVPA